MKLIFQMKRENSEALLPDERRGWNTGVRRNDVSRILAKLGYQSYVIIAYLNYLYFIYFICFHSCDTEIIVYQYISVRSGCNLIMEGHPHTIRSTGN